MKKSKELDLWFTQAEQMEEVLGNILEPDKFQKWIYPLRTAASGYNMNEPIFESDAESIAEIKKLQKILNKLTKGYEKQKAFSKLMIDVSAKKHSINNLHECLCDLEGTFNGALKDIQDKRDKFKAAGIKTAQPRLHASNILIECLLDVYVDTTNNKIGFSFDGMKKEPSGPLFRFISPIIKIFEPHIESTTLLDRMQTVHKQRQKLAEIQ